MEATVENAAEVAKKAKGTILALEEAYPNEPRLLLLHRQFNTVALIAGHVHGLDFGGSGSLADTDPVVGGTNKGDPM